MKPLAPGDYRNWQGTHIQFLYRGTTKSGKTRIWDVRNGDASLGEIKWFSRWRCYSFFPATGTVFEEVCLGEIKSFIRLVPTLVFRPTDEPASTVI